MSSTRTDKNAVGVNLHAFNGEVMDSKKWASTYVSGGGSTSGSTYQGTGYTSGTSSISSTTTTHEQFFLRNGNGEERSFEFANWGVAVRSGHYVSVIWGIKEGKEAGPYIGVYNHNTKEMGYNTNGIDRLTQAKLAGCGMQILGAIGLLTALIAFGTEGIPGMLIHLNGLLGLLLIGAAVWIFRARKDRAAALRSAVQSLVSEIKTMSVGLVGATPTMT